MSNDCFSACCGCCGISCPYCKNGKAPRYWRVDPVFSEGDPYIVAGCENHSTFYHECCWQNQSPPLYPAGGYYPKPGNPFKCNGACESFNRTWLLEGFPENCSWAATHYEETDDLLCPVGYPNIRGGVTPDPCCRYVIARWCAIPAHSCTASDYYPTCECPYPSSSGKPPKSKCHLDRPGSNCFGPCSVGMGFTITDAFFDGYHFIQRAILSISMGCGCQGSVGGCTPDCSKAWEFAKTFYVDPEDPLYTGPPDCTGPMALDLQGIMPFSFCTDYMGYTSTTCWPYDQGPYEGCRLTGTTIAVYPVFTGPLPLAASAYFAYNAEPLYFRKKGILYLNAKELKRLNIIKNWEKTLLSIKNPVKLIEKWGGCEPIVVNQKEEIEEIEEVEEVEEIEIEETKKHKKVSLLKKISNLGSSLYNWNREGRPLRDKEEIEDIYDNICTKCPYFSNDQCGLCGCGIKRSGVGFNKLAFATESCPDHPPRWGIIPPETPESSDVPILDKFNIGSNDLIHLIGDSGQISPRRLLKIL